MGELYRLDFSNGKSYVGITTGRASDRFVSHRTVAKQGHKKTPVYSAWRKYGEPDVVLLAIVEDKELAETEIRAIRSFNTILPNGYNVSSGGEVSPMKDPAVAAKVSAARKGTKMSDETKAKMSASLIGNKRLLGHRHSEESRFKMSIARKGKKFNNPERSKKLSDSLKGRKASEETRKNNSEAARSWMKEMKISDPEGWNLMVKRRNLSIKAAWAAKKENQQ